MGFPYGKLSGREMGMRTHRTGDDAVCVEFFSHDYFVIVAHNITICGGSVCRWIYISFAGFTKLRARAALLRAADKLFLSQPAISLQIKALEDELGKALFDRKRREIRLTEAGEVLFKYVQQIFDGLEDARNEIAALDKEVSGRWWWEQVIRTALISYRMCWKNSDAAIPESTLIFAIASRQRLQSSW